MTILSFQNAGIHYGDRVALSGFNLDIAPGQIVGLIGESGSGKSSAALAAMGLLPDGVVLSGRVLLNGQDWATLTPAQGDRLRGRVAGMIFQEPLTALNPILSIGAQVAEAVRTARGLGRRAAWDGALGLLDRVGLDPAQFSPHRFPHQLSGGQRQRVGIAIAIAGGPKLLIADEPTTALDVTTQAQVMDLIVRLVREEGMGLLLVSHDLGLVGQVADHIAVLKDGQLVEQGPAEAVLTRPAAPYTRSLLERARHQPLRSPAIDRARPPILSVSGLSRVYPGTRQGLFRRGEPVRAVADVSFDIAPGETLGVVGESGSGKSSLLRCVLGLDLPQAGQILLDGQPLHGRTAPEQRALRRQMQAVFQDPAGSFNPRQRVETIVAEPLHLLDKPLTAADRRQRVEKVLERVGLSAADATRYPHQFSGGQRQRIALARALIVEPRLVVLDEAVSALDVSIRADILDLLARLSAELGLAYLFVSHDLSVMRAITDRVLVIRQGRIVEQGPTAKVLSAPVHPYTAQLLAATPQLPGA
ncbi:ABC transporter ATP-binding protein [Niveispirillum sp. BGYR6]|uniref:dipeptide ABC transporter ATP-binding protein n=1 Tax=Niveispirillum sp. BGYR6 TaxID=2971249 RepID=UPI0022B95DF4|nr:ABC transporter ATP-binding protein [Niveispirillum sp. BGYR6]MDG5496051.1 ABC transporter ATP-binding protein [Niveispirillum sp. BGYR6]